MGDLTKYDIYKINGLSIEGYIFSIQEDTEEEPTYNYYMITLGSNNKPLIHRLNNTIEILSDTNINLIPVDMDSPELQKFIKLVDSTIPMNPTKQTLQLTKKQ
jgi:hypothetical protein